MPVSQQEYSEVFKETVARCLRDKISKSPLDSLQRNHALQFIQKLVDEGLMDEVGEEVGRTLGMHQPSASKPQADHRQNYDVDVASTSEASMCDAPILPPKPIVGALIGSPGDIHRNLTGDVQVGSEDLEIASVLRVSTMPTFCEGLPSSFTGGDEVFWNQFITYP